MDVSEFKLRFSEFQNTPDSLITLHLNDAAYTVRPSVWGSLTSIASGLLAAHTLTVTSRGSTGAAGPVTSESVGEISRSYAASSSSGEGSFASTAYGQEFVRLRRTLFITPLVL